MAEQEKVRPKDEAKPAPADEAEVAAVERRNEEIINGQRRVRIRIMSGRNAQERAPVPVGVNGRAYLIERDREVLVPESVVRVLEMAVEKQAVEVVEDGQTRTVFQDTPRFPFQVLGHA